MYTNPRGKNIPNIKLDLTADEHLAHDPVHLPIYHPYSDAPEEAQHFSDLSGVPVKAIRDASPQALHHS